MLAVHRTMLSIIKHRRLTILKRYISKGSLEIQGDTSNIHNKCLHTKLISSKLLIQVYLFNLLP